MWNIQPARPEQGSDILRIAAHAGNFDPEDVACIRGLWEASQAQGPEAAGFHFLVYCDEGAPLGFICYGPHVGVTGPYDVYWLAVDAQVHRQHIGQHILEHTEREVQARGGNLLYIETAGRADYTATRAFYKACGYQDEAHIPDFYAPGDGLVIFIKRF